MEREKIIKDYITAYNNFDIEKMLTHLDEQIKFENISNGVTNMTLTDLNSFREQAQQAKKLFTTRKQTIKSWTHQDNLTEIEIEYNAVLAIDLPNGLKKDDILNLEGKSIFKFSGDKIIELTDIS
jgi:allophanate hydrolase subunit 1